HHQDEEATDEQADQHSAIPGDSGIIGVLGILLLNFGRVCHDLLLSAREGAIRMPLFWAQVVLMRSSEACRRIARARTWARPHRFATTRFWSPVTESPHVALRGSDSQVVR